MAGVLIFKVDDTLRNIVAHARAATERRATYVELMDDDLIKPEARNKPWHERCSEDVDQSRIQPALWLVKDRGVYIMSNGVDHPKRSEKPLILDVAYALGLNADTDDCWDLARQIMGGDDCVETLSLDFIEAKIARGATEIQVRVTKEHIAIL